MEANPFSIDSILKKTNSSPNVEEEVKEAQPSKSSEALSLAVKLAGKFKPNLCLRLGKVKGFNNLVL